MATLLWGTPSWGGQTAVFNAPKPLKQVLQLLTRATRRIDVGMFLLSDGRVISALQNAADRGVAVRLLLEVSNRSNRRSLKHLKNKRIEVRWFKSLKKNSKVRMHARAACADGEKLLIGSADWTRRALSRDWESLVRIHDQGAAKNWLLQFDKAWKVADTKLPRQWQLRDELKALPDPQVYMEGDPRLNNRRGK